MNSVAKCVFIGSICGGYLYNLYKKLSQIQEERKEVIGEIATLHLAQACNVHFDRFSMPFTAKRHLEATRKFREIEKKIDQHWFTKIPNYLGRLRGNRDFEIAITQSELNPADKKGLLFSPHGWNTFYDFMSLSLETEDPTLAIGMIERSLYHLENTKKNDADALEQALADFDTSSTLGDAIKKAAQYELDHCMQEQNFQENIQIMHHLSKEIYFYLEEGCFRNDSSEYCLAECKRLKKAIDEVTVDHVEKKLQLRAESTTILQYTEKVYQNTAILGQWSKKIPISDERLQDLDYQIIKSGGKIYAAMANDTIFNGLSNVLLTQCTILNPSPDGDE